MKPFRRADGSRREQPRDPPVYEQLRSQVLALTPDQVAPADGTSLLAMLMETGYPEAVVTLVGVADGSTSLYFSHGGGIIGAGEHARVAAATRRWLGVCADSLDVLERVADPPPVPDVHRTQFVGVAEDGLRCAAAPERALVDGAHVLSPLFHAAQDVITQIRLLDETDRG